jgi:hypothetical protein
MKKLEAVSVGGVQRERKKKKGKKKSVLFCELES